MLIRTKSEFYSLWKAGVLGNRPQMWDTAEEAYNSGEPYIGLREKNPKGGGGRWEIVHRSELFLTVTQWHIEGRRPTYDSAAPNEHCTLQGEICRTVRGLEGYLALRSGLAMRPAMAAGKMQSYGYAACVLLLNQFLDASSKDTLDDLLELYPDATIEFTAYDRNTGIFGRNTIFWEVRNY